MHVGVLRLTLHIPHARSLKDKRATVRRFRDRVRARFDVSIAEVDSQDLLQLAVFGVAVVSADRAVCDSVMADVAREAEVAPDAVLSRRETEIVTFGEDFYGG